MSKLIRAIAAALAISLILSMCVFAKECYDIRGSVLRLHVLANSDSEADQELKLKVRDAVIEASAGMVDAASNEGEAKELVSARLPEIRSAAQKCVYDEGYDYEIDAEICEMYFTTRRYDFVTMPAGIYEALRITIGSGEGKNWWCVVFPPMCVSAATDSATLSDVLEPKQEDIVTNGDKYEVRFKIVEVICDIGNIINNWFR